MSPGLARALESLSRRTRGSSRASRIAPRRGGRFGAGAGSCREATPACRGRSSQTRSAVSRVQPPRKTLMSLEELLLLFARGGRSDHAIVALQGRVARRRRRERPSAGRGDLPSRSSSSFGREQLRTGGCELEREREPVESLAELADRRCRLDVWADRACSSRRRDRRLPTRRAAAGRARARPGRAGPPELVTKSRSGGAAATSSASGRAASGSRCSRLSTRRCVRLSPTRPAIGVGARATLRPGGRRSS